MTGIGAFLRQARLKQNKSLYEVARETKIKKSFIEAMEEENWEALPEFPVVQGFVKNIASFLGLDEEKALAFLRRDYPPKKLSVSPKPDVENKFAWTPRRTFVFGILVVFASVLIYLGLQYRRFIKSPLLEVISPKEGEIITMKDVLVSGKTNADASVVVNNQPALIDNEGQFEAQIEVSQDTHEIEVQATSRSGKQTTIKRKIEVRIVP